MLQAAHLQTAAKVFKGVPKLPTCCLSESGRVSRRAALLAGALACSVPSAKAMAASRESGPQPAYSTVRPGPQEFIEQLPQWIPEEEVPETRGVDEELQSEQELAPEEPSTPRPPGQNNQYLIVMRHGERIDEVDPTWVLQAERTYDPQLSSHGVQQARDVAESLKQYDIKEIHVSPFLRTLQTAMYTAEGLAIPPDHWTATCSVSEFLNVWILTRKGGQLPEGNINDWFWRSGSLKDDLPLKLPKEAASRMQVGHDKFDRYPENLLNSRARYGRAFQSIADKANGKNVLIVTHGDAVNASVSRLFPWAIVYPVLHTGYTVAYRERQEDGHWGAWALQSHSGENGVWWTNKLRPVYQLWNQGRKAYHGMLWAIDKYSPWRGGYSSTAEASTEAAERSKE